MRFILVYSMIIIFSLILLMPNSLFAQVPSIGPSGCVDPRGCDFPGGGGSISTSYPMDFTVRLNRNGFDVQKCFSGYVVDIGVTKLRGDTETVYLDATNWNSVGIETTIEPTTVYPFQGTHHAAMTINISCDTPADVYQITVRGVAQFRQSNDVVMVRVIESQSSLRVDGDTYYRSGNYALAAEYYKDATDFSGKPVTLSKLFNSAGVAYAKQGHQEFSKVHQSKFYFDQAIRIDSNNQMAKNNMRIVSDILQDKSLISQLGSLQISLTAISGGGGSGNSGGGGCLIATAAYGTELDPKIQNLREIRNKMYDTELGDIMRGINQFYYSFSPTVADWERQNAIFKEMVKLFITPSMVSFTILDHDSIRTQEGLIRYVVSVIFLNIGMYIGIPASVIIGIRTRF